MGGQQMHRLRTILLAKRYFPTSTIKGRGLERGGRGRGVRFGQIQIDMSVCVWHRDSVRTERSKGREGEEGKVKK